MALVKGPFVYCLEETDNSSELCGITVHASSAIAERFDPSVLGGTLVLELSGEKETQTGLDGVLYETVAPQKKCFY